MAESPIEKLKRLAAEKKVAAAQPVTEVKVTETVNVDNSLATVSQESTANGTESAGTGEATSNSGDIQQDVAKGESLLDQAAPEAQLVESGSDIPSTDLVAPSSPTRPDHPLAMQFAELEQALLAADPGFKSILRDVHRELGKDPELVTMASEEEIAMMVRGMIAMANAEVVEPAKAKAAKAAVAEAKKKVITADDL